MAPRHAGSRGDPGETTADTALKCNHRFHLKHNVPDSAPTLQHLNRMATALLFFPSFAFIFFNFPKDNVYNLIPPGKTLFKAAGRFPSAIRAPAIWFTGREK